MTEQTAIVKRKYTKEMKGPTAAMLDDPLLESLGKKLDKCAGEECCDGCKVAEECGNYWDIHVVALSMPGKLKRWDYNRLDKGLSLIALRK